MSEAADTAHVSMTLADYAAVDQGQKINMVGGSISLVGYDFNVGVTVPFTVVAWISFDSKFGGHSPAIELLLEDDTGAIVELPGPPNPVDAPRYVRVGAAEVLRPAEAGLRPRSQIVLNFATGLPLTAGQIYRWRVKIDGSTQDSWTYDFLVVKSSGLIVG
ncbi:hypothetical protein ACQPXH_26195 [Nocardia sp. CA-135953]|uniref:hypothetical protein n=1 Tax=Nocardia sp. CA-135953 TaxID=3239978 RepID=UPI003D9657BB